jgi:response regulator of citrate/malate metabolism
MKRLRALVLEDERPARLFLARLIEGTQLAQVVGAASTIAEALKVLRAVPVDVVFVDIRLAGGESGLDLVHSFRAPGDGPGEVNRPLFVLTTAVERHTLRAFELGVIDYLLKPLTAERVERCLRRISGLLDGAPHARA